MESYVVLSRSKKLLVTAGLIFTLLLSSLSLGVPSTGAADLNYTADTYIIVNGLTLVIKSGSKLTRLVINDITASFTVPGQATFTVESETGKLLTDSPSPLQNCSDVGGKLKNNISVDGPVTFTINPIDLSCKQSTLGRFSQGSSQTPAVVVSAPSGGGGGAAPAPTSSQQVAVDEATKKANEAQAAATEATKKANEAQAASIEARLKADEALTAADEAKALAVKAASADAQKKAEEAIATALEALKKADEATAKAGEARKKAAEVSDAATQAKVKADQASTLAAQAQAKAAEVGALAADAKAKADEAKKTAADAKAKAESAVASIQDVDKQAQSAEKTANAAKEQARELTVKKALTEAEKKAEAENLKEQLKQIKTEVKEFVPTEKKPVITPEEKEVLDDAKALGFKLANVVGKKQTKATATQQAVVANLLTVETETTKDLELADKVKALQQFIFFNDGKLPEKAKDVTVVLKLMSNLALTNNDIAKLARAAIKRNEDAFCQPKACKGFSDFDAYMRGVEPPYDQKKEAAGIKLFIKRVGKKPDLTNPLHENLVDAFGNSDLSKVKSTPAKKTTTKRIKVFVNP